ncbi:MAG: hypothetical protein ACJ76Z_03855 [Thermoleophilaceae bacterium]
MSLYDVLLFAHVFGAFSLIAGTTAMAPFALGIGAAAFERAEAARVAAVGAVMSGIGAVLTIGIGSWLVANRGYHLLRLWLLGAYVLWGIAGFSNGQVSTAARRFGNDDGGPPDVKRFWYADAIAAGLILVLMIWKPGH